MDKTTETDRPFWWRTNPGTNLMLLAARLYAGITIASAGWDKLPTPDWMVDQVISLNLFPAPSLFAVAACFTEFVGGILLAFGLYARCAALLLAITMSVASFGFHKLVPILDMHIAQGFVWLFVVFLAIGPGKLSLDYCLRPSQFDDAPRLRTISRTRWFAGGLILITLSCGLYRQFIFQRPVAEPPVIASIQVAGSFNDWSLSANPLEKTSDNVWFAELELRQPGLIEFKFAVDDSWETNFGSSTDAAQTLPLIDEAESNGRNIVVQIPEPGTYRIEVDSQKFEYTMRAIEGAGGEQP